MMGKLGKLGKDWQINMRARRPISQLPTMLKYYLFKDFLLLLVYLMPLHSSQWQQSDSTNLVLPETSQAELAIEII